MNTVSSYSVKSNINVFILYVSKYQLNKYAGNVLHAIDTSITSLRNFRF